MPSRVVAHHTQSRNRKRQRNLRSKVKNVYYQHELTVEITTFSYSRLRKNCIVIVQSNLESHPAKFKIPSSHQAGKTTQNTKHHKNGALRMENMIIFFQQCSTSGKRVHDMYTP